MRISDWSSDVCSSDLNLPEKVRALDPLLTAAAVEGEKQGRFAGHGDLIDRWIAPAFNGESAEWRRIRRAACLLADVGWRANPEFRAERGLEIALHGNWVGIDVAGRAMLAQALYSHTGGGIGRALWWGRVCPYVWISGVGVSIKKK